MEYQAAALLPGTLLQPRITHTARIHLPAGVAPGDDKHYLDDMIGHCAPPPVGCSDVAWTTRSPSTFLAHQRTGCDSGWFIE
jgi:hypothetical protein